MRMTSLWKYGRGMWLNFVLNLGRAVIKRLNCYGKHMVAKHLAMLQYFIGGGTSKMVTREWSTKHVPERALSITRVFWQAIHCGYGCQYCQGCGAVGKWPKANVTQTFGFTEHLLWTHPTHCDKDIANVSCVCQVGTKESHRRADARMSWGVHEHCSNVWDNSEFLNLDCDVWRIVDLSLWPIIKTTAKCVETLEFATTQKIPFISLGG